MNPADTRDNSFTRRDFVKTGSAALLAMLQAAELLAQETQQAASAAAPAEPKPEGPKVKVAVIGLGPWGREILDQLERWPREETHAQVVALCDNYKPMLNRSASKAPGAALVEDYRAVLDNKDVQAVIIATPTHLHREIAVAALQAGKHVYCEAPLAHTIEDARAIAQAARNAPGRFFQAGLQQRCDPQRHWLLPFVRSGALGRFALARAQWHKKQSWRGTSPNPEREKAMNWRLRRETSPGLVGEIGIHALDQAGWFLNDRPVAVTGFGSIAFWRDDGRDVPDTVQVVVEYASGVRLLYDATLANSFDGEYEMYYGSDAALMIRDVPTSAWMFKEVDSPLLGWEVYARKDSFFKESGIALVAGASKQDALTGGQAASAFPYSPLAYALAAFLRNCAEMDAAVEDFKSTFNTTDPKALAEYLAGLTRPPIDDPASAQGAKENAARQAPREDVGYAATVLALKANEAILKGSRIELKKEWFELS
ncbi:MAG: Gfo/Idh/MocA family oxidoreductase [Verrucomicrobiales bacterium]|nr:Gfo/Idh/MocA family oxidoreductase [Verrucomicrobiales bacterium]